MSCRIPWRRAAVGALAALSICTAPARGGGEQASPTDVMVQLRPGASIAFFNALFGTSTIASYPSQNLFRLLLPAGLAPDQFEALAAGNGDVLHADQIFPVLEDNPEGSTQSFFFSVAPVRYTQQAAAERTRADELPAGAKGGGVIVAVIDSGVGEHPVLVSGMQPGAYDFVTLATGAPDAPDFVDNNQNGAIDEFAGHGTAMAGLVRRVAPDAGLLAIGVADSDGQSDTYLLAVALHYAIDQGADVMSVSMGTIDPADVLQAAVTRARTAGVIIVAAAGNDGNATPARYPAAFADVNVIAVAATDDFDVRAPFSSYGPHVDLVAPGVEVASTLPDGLYGAGSGTSMSTPLVAGTLAAMRGILPAATMAQLRTLLRAGTDNIDARNPSEIGQLGAGRLNAANAVTLAVWRYMGTGLLGPGIGVPVPHIAADVDVDGDCDLHDLARLQTGMAAVVVPPPP